MSNLGSKIIHVGMEPCVKPDREIGFEYRDLLGQVEFTFKTEEVIKEGRDQRKGKFNFLPGKRFYFVPRNIENAFGDLLDDVATDKGFCKVTCGASRAAQLIDELESAK